MKLTPNQARTIRTAYVLKNRSLTELARTFHVTPAAIYFIVHGETHKKSGGLVVKNKEHRELLHGLIHFILWGWQTHKILIHARQNYPAAAEIPMSDLLDDIIELKHAIFENGNMVERQ